MKTLMAFVGILLVLVGMTAWAWEESQPVSIPPLERLEVVEGIMRGASTADTANLGSYRLLSLWDQPLAIRYQYAPRDDPTERERVNRELAPGARIRAWVDPDRPKQLWDPGRENFCCPGIRAWQLEKDGQLFRSYADTVQLQEELNRSIKGPFLVLGILMFGMLWLLGGLRGWLREHSVSM